MDITEVSTAKSHKDNKGTGPSVICGEAERTGTVQVGEQKAQGELNHVYKYLTGRVKKMELDSSLQYPQKEQEAMGTD